MGGGYRNTASDYAATAGGGYLNEASGRYATVPGGYYNQASGDYSFAAGRRAKAYGQGCFVWGDSTNADISCNNNNRTVFRSSGGFYIYTSSDLSTGAYLASGSGTWNSLSDRNAKENFEPVDPQAVLEGVVQLPITTWNYKAEDDSIRHMGPVAQDFYAAFGLGDSDKAIATVDADGVALAAIQGLYAQNQALEAENAQLRARVEELEQENAAQQEQIDALRQENAAQQAQIDALEARLAALEQGSPLTVHQSGVLPGAGLALLGLGAALAMRRKGGGQ